MLSCFEVISFLYLITMYTKNSSILLKSVVAVLFIFFLAIPVWMAASGEKGSKSERRLAKSELIMKYGFYFEEVAKKSGVVFRHESPVLDKAFDPILPQIASMGASVAVSDFDNDGWNDFYVTSSRFGSKNALYHNQKDGTFKDVAGITGVSDINLQGTGVSMGSVWADYDNDGYEDLFVYKWGRSELFKNIEGKSFKKVTETCGLPDWINANTAIWFDYNSDGLVDLFIGGYFPETVDLWNLTSTKVLTESFEYSQNGGRNYLFKNNGNGTFQDVTFETGLVSTRWTLAAGAMDIDKDGFPELFIANDYGVDEFYLNEKGKRFVEKSKNALIGFAPKSGMNVTFGDVYNKGQQGIYISNITEDGILMQGNNFWVPVVDNNKILFVNVANDAGIESGGWSYGAQFGDLNNDGFQDLYLANGFISAEEGTSYWYDYSKVTGGNKAIISDVKNWPAMNGRSQSGFQENRLWLNTGDGHFEDVADKVGGNSAYDSRGVAMADLWNRGMQDVIVANQNNEILIYKNQVDEKNNWIAFELKGSTVNKSAIGATIDLYFDSGVQSQVITGGIGFCSQNQRRAHFGLGKNLKVEKAEILWPGGKKQIVQSPEINKIHIIKEK